MTLTYCNTVPEEVTQTNTVCLRQKQNSVVLAISGLFLVEYALLKKMLNEICLDDVCWLIGLKRILLSFCHSILEEDFVAI